MYHYDCSTKSNVFVFPIGYLQHAVGGTLVVWVAACVEARLCPITHVATIMYVSSKASYVVLHTLQVSEFVTPEAFDTYARAAESMGFLYVASGPMVRSSYRAGEFYLKNLLHGNKQQQQQQESNATLEAVA